MNKNQIADRAISFLEDYRIALQQAQVDGNAAKAAEYKEKVDLLSVIVEGKLS